MLTRERVVRERVPADPPCSDAIIYDLEGEVFFGSAPELDRCFDDLKRRTSETDIGFVVPRLRRVRNPDLVFLSARNISCTKCAGRAGPCCCAEFVRN